MARIASLHRYLGRRGGRARSAVQSPAPQPGRGRKGWLAGVVLGVISALPFPSASHAASSPWLTVQGGRVRLVALAPESDGRIPALLDIRLQPGWHTYWREPGAGGIPPTLTFADPGVELKAIDFPVPQRFLEGDVSMAGYAERAQFPLTLSLEGGTAPAQLDADLFIGICKEICIPVSGRLSLALPPAGSFEPLDAALIDTARAALPPATSEGLSVTPAVIAPSRDSLRFTLTSGEAPDALPEVFLAGPSGVGFGPPVVTAQGDGRFQVTVPLRLGKEGERRLAEGAILAIRHGDATLETRLPLN